MYAWEESETRKRHNTSEHKSQGSIFKENELPQVGLEPKTLKKDKAHNTREHTLQVNPQTELLRWDLNPQQSAYMYASMHVTV
jgi:hypothetical protein